MFKGSKVQGQNYLSLLNVERLKLERLNDNACFGPFILPLPVLCSSAEVIEKHVTF